MRTVCIIPIVGDPCKDSWLQTAVSPPPPHAPLPPGLQALLYLALRDPQSLPAPSGKPAAVWFGWTFPFLAVTYLDNTKELLLKIFKHRIVQKLLRRGAALLWSLLGQAWS